MRTKIMSSNMHTHLGTTAFLVKEFNPEVEVVSRKNFRNEQDTLGNE